MSTSDLEIFLKQSLIENGHDYSAAVQQQLLNYLELLQKWNQVINLTAIRNVDDMVTHHILDSLSIIPYLHGQRFIDVGTGAGLPGIPLAITQPDKEFCLLDSNSKKTRFLTQVVLELGLKNVSIVHARCEEFQPEKCFDAVITRAFSSLKEILIHTQHMLCTQGEILAMKGIYPKDEINQIPSQFKLIAVDDLKIKGLNQNRCLVRLELHTRFDQDDQLE